MAANPYDILGVSKSASEAEIKSAYRKLAKKLHPDVNPGRKDIEQKFKDVTAAYDLLSDKDKRVRFDRGEIDGQGQERGFGGYGRGGYGRSARGGPDPFAGFSTGTGGIDMDEILAEFMGAARGGKRGGAPPRGTDVTYSLNIPFIEACIGGKKRVTLTGGKTIDVAIPSGSEEGNKLRLRGQGESAGSSTGDAIIEIHIEPHPFFTRKDNDIYLEAPVSLPESVLGASIRVPTLDGHVAVKVPKGANTGTVLRLKGKGVPGKGDMLVKLKVVLPENHSEELDEFMEKWSKKNGYDPRKGLGW